MEMPFLQVNYGLSIQACNAGLFISTGQGKHPNRIINSYELIFVRSGVLGIQEENQAFQVRAGESLLLWPNRRHWGTMVHPPDLSFYWLHFYLKNGESGPAALDIPQHTLISRPEYLTELFRSFLNDQESGFTHHPGCDFLVALMLCEVTRNIPQSICTGNVSILANHAEVYIQTHFREPLSTSLIAVKLGCNPDYLGRVFQKTYGKTIIDRIHECRLHQAHLLLLDGTVNIEEIAWTCGYDDVRYFRQQFKRWKGMTPTTYRKLYTQVHINTR